MTEKERYHLRVGDLLHNRRNGAFGLLVKITKRYFYFELMSMNLEDRFQMSRERARKSLLYEYVDVGALDIYLGSSRRRRKRPFHPRSEMSEEQYELAARMAQVDGA